MDKETLEAFVDQYKSKKGKKIESLVSYVSFDKKKVNNEKNNIISILVNYFNLSNEFNLVYVGYLMDYIKINNFEDIIFLNDVIGLLLACGILENNYLIMFPEFASMDNEDLKYLNPEEFDLSTVVNAKHYVKKFKEVAKSVYYPVNTDLIKNNQKSLTTDDIKKILIYWFTSTSSIKIIPPVMEKINYLLDHNLKEMLDYCAFLDLESISADSAIIDISLSNQANVYDKVYDELKRFDSKALDKFTEYKTMFIEHYKQLMDIENEINNIKRGM